MPIRHACLSLDCAACQIYSQPPGRTQVARGAYERLKHKYVLVPRGEIDIKGKGDLETRFLESPK